ncbi:MAG: hypothetical protein ACD_73C00269G0001 [uncultured bacterium]|nr:MAG: hypothetical protein ACD_73C00269G0001 [uncultured bacterium]
MDPLIAKLNQAVLSQIETPKSFTSAPGFQSGETSNFQATLDNKWTDKLMEKVMGGGSDQNQMKVLSADNIHVETKTGEMANSQKIGVGDQYFDMFKNINRDMLSVDSAVETLSAPGVKLTPQQLLGLQAGISQVSIYAESFSKLTSTVAQGINSLVQTQV